MSKAVVPSNIPLTELLEIEQSDKSDDDISPFSHGNPKKNIL